MKEHLSTSVEAGTVERLQTLAGGQRKVGEFLSDLVDLLWQHRAIVESTNLRELVIAGPKQRSDLEAEISALDAQIVEMAKRQERMEHDLSYFRAVVESAVSKTPTDQFDSQPVGAFATGPHQGD